MDYIIINQTLITIVALIISALSAVIAFVSALHAQKANRINILPVVTLDMDGNPNSNSVTLKNIGVGVAHKIEVYPVQLLTNRGTPHRKVVMIKLEQPGRNYLAAGEAVTFNFEHSYAWYLKSSEEGYALMPIYYSDSLGNRYIMLLKLGKGHIDIEWTPRKYGLGQKIFNALSKIRVKAKVHKFMSEENNPKLRVNR